MTKNTYTCSMCNKTYTFDGPIPVADANEMVICTACNNRVQAVLLMFGTNQEVTCH